MVEAMTYNYRDTDLDLQVVDSVIYLVGTLVYVFGLGNHDKHKAIEDPQQACHAGQASARRSAGFAASAEHNSLTFITKWPLDFVHIPLAALLLEGPLEGKHALPQSGKESHKLPNSSQQERIYPYLLGGRNSVHGLGPLFEPL